MSSSNRKSKKSRKTKQPIQSNSENPGEGSIKLKIKLGHQPSPPPSRVQSRPIEVLDVLDPSQMVVTDTWIKPELLDDDIEYSTSEYESLSDTSETVNVTMTTDSKAALMVEPGDIIMDVDVEKQSTGGMSDEEEKWLDALESGKLDDSGGILKKKDPLLMTARQRALHLGEEEKLLQLPTGARRAKLTEKQNAQRKEKAEKRKQLAYEKREKDKKDTLERLLKKQDSRRGLKSKSHRKSNVPGFRYLNTQDSISISVPPNCHDPYIKEVAPDPPAVRKCEVTGCNNKRSYSCAKTGTSLCSSLQCYKTNLQYNGIHQVAVT